MRRLKMRHLMPKYNRILCSILSQNSTNCCKNFDQFTAQCDSCYLVSLTVCVVVFFFSDILSICSTV